MSLKTPIKVTKNIQCPYCSFKDNYTISIYDLQYQSSYEENMGAQIQYDTEEIITCVNCNKEFNVTIDVWEYPEGVLNLIELINISK